MTPAGKTVAGRLTGRRIHPEPLAGPQLMQTPGAPASAPGTVVAASSLVGLVQHQLSGKFNADPGIRFGDGSFYLPRLSEVELILRNSQADRRVWLAERFDCDDFSYVLKGEVSVHAYDAGALRFALCFGMVWGNFDWLEGYHAVNWFIADDQVLRFVEPQTDEIYAAGRCQGDITLLLV